MWQECAEGGGGEHHVTDNPAVIPRTAARKTVPRLMALKMNATLRPRKMASAKCQRSFTATSSRHFMGEKHQVKVEEFVRQGKLKPDRNNAGAKGPKHVDKCVHSGASTSRTKQQASRKAVGPTRTA
ncbi:hypothetical protein MRX96_043300 [Rhipicephalus microplus]